MAKPVARRVGRSRLSPASDGDVATTEPLSTLITAALPATARPACSFTTTTTSTGELHRVPPLGRLAVGLAGVILTASPGSLACAVRIFRHMRPRSTPAPRSAPASWSATGPSCSPATRCTSPWPASSWPMQWPLDADPAPGSRRRSPPSTRHRPEPRNERRPAGPVRNGPVRCRHAPVAEPPIVPRQEAVCMTCRSGRARDAAETCPHRRRRARRIRRTRPGTHGRGQRIELTSNGSQVSGDPADLRSEPGRKVVLTLR